MPSIGSTAKVTTRSLDDVHAISWEVWDAAVKLAKSRGGHKRKGPNQLDGYVLRGSMSEVIRTVLPHTRALPPVEWEKVSRSITAHLKATGNAICISQKSPTQWWLSAVWLDSAARDERQLTRQEEAERKVTPHEAGEDREPAPVRVIKLRTAPTSGDDMEKKVLELLGAHPDQPVSALEVALALDDTWQRKGSDHPAAGGNTKDALEALVKAKKVHRRRETSTERRVRMGVAEGDPPPSGRFAYVYSLHSPVPPRTERAAFPGVELSVPPVNGEGGRRHGERLRTQRNDRVLTVLIELGVPANVTKLSKLSGLSRHQLEQSLRELLADGLVHHDHYRRTGREWLPIDVPFPTDTAKTAPQKETTPVPTPPEYTPGLTAAQRAVVKAALDLAAQGRDFTATELATITGFSPSHCNTVLRSGDTFVKTGKTRNRGRVYAARTVYAARSAPVPVPATAPPPAPPVPPAPVADADERLRKVAELLGVTGDAQRVAELEAQVASLTERLEKALAQIRALTAI